MMDTYESLLKRAETQLIESSTIILQLEDELAILRAWKEGAQIVFDDLGITYTAIEFVHEGRAPND